MGQLKILVFDDSESHRKSAELTLEGHDVTIVGTYDEAQKALIAQTDYDESDRLFDERYKDLPLCDLNEEEREVRFVFQCDCHKKATTHPDFDIVMTDLMVLASRQAQDPEGEHYVGQEMPIGTTIALLSLCAGIKKVAVVTDQNHHDHPASAAFDCFSGKGKLEGVEIICTNHVGMISIDEKTGRLVSQDFLDSPLGEEKYPYFEGNWGPRKDIRRGGKNWGEILARFSFPD
ncbi:MAG: hypothetical protein KAS02_01125 [Candidatus Pacebacteria bacterium]|nr:hypothetical protein [Candidatus Paceibacterota bacterium]